jgi:hypothetical protein
MLRKTMMVLATAATFTAVLTANAFARGFGSALTWAVALLVAVSELRSSGLQFRASTGNPLRISRSGAAAIVRLGTAAMTMICLGMAIMIRRLSRPTSSSPIRPLSFSRRPRLMPKSYLTRTRECQAKNPPCCALASYW